jgi:hypothetical protein
MSSPKTLEEQLLKTAAARLDRALSEVSAPSRQEARLQILECAASRLGSFPLADYFHRFAIRPVLSMEELDAHAQAVLAALRRLPVHPALALSSLSREPLSAHAQRTAGAYYTDFRLAAHVAEQGVAVWVRGKPIVDPACGAGILLTAVVIAICGADRKKVAELIATQVIAADASPMALRGACLAIASLTNDLDAIASMRGNWIQGDSLLHSDAIWERVAPQGFGLVVANPPWEKVKVTRHEFAKSTGKVRNYGESHAGDRLHGLDEKRAQASGYARELAKRYPLAAAGEIDLYIAFLDLCLRLAQGGGGVSALVPAGLIRSEGTAQLRRYLLATAKQLETTVFDNRSRFFSIDTRFKFLGLLVQTSTSPETAGVKTLKLAFATGTDKGVQVTSHSNVSVRALQRLRHDLTVPEVRTSQDWTTFAKMADHGVSWHDDTGQWRPVFCREVDMTKEKEHFTTSPGLGLLPLIEGRMVHQHRYGAKKYVAGTGRSAIWDAQPVGASVVAPQYWIGTRDLPGKALERAAVERAGFCDITGQTNERSMMAALIPAGVACGNKVPTLLFDGDSKGQRLRLWVGFVNSLPFDWLMRRLVTTTVNYFLLRGVPLPAIEPNSLPGREIATAVDKLKALDGAGSSAQNGWAIAELRARIDLLCLIGYGVGYEELEAMLQDFPLLDRAQPPLPGEPRSTITRDYLLLTAAKRFRKTTTALQKRVEAACLLNAIPYVPSQADVSSGDHDNQKTG